MRDVTLEFDGAGTLQASTYMLASARDWARFGLLFLNDGVLGGKRILHEDWVDFSAAPTLDTDYGAGFWTNRSENQYAKGRVRLGIPRDAFFASGDLGQRVVIIPSQHMVVVRLGEATDPTGDIQRQINTLIQQAPFAANASGASIAIGDILVSAGNVSILAQTLSGTQASGKPAPAISARDSVSIAIDNQGLNFMSLSKLTVTGVTGGHVVFTGAATNSNTSTGITFTQDNTGSTPVVNVNVRQSKISSCGSRPCSAQQSSWMRLAISTLRSAVLPIPTSSIVSAISAAP